MATRHKGNSVTTADQKYILRFEEPDHRERIKQQARMEKRSLNRQLLLLIEAGERALYPKPPRPQKDQQR